MSEPDFSRPSTLVQPCTCVMSPRTFSEPAFAIESFVGPLSVSSSIVAEDDKVVVPAAESVTL